MKKRYTIPELAQMRESEDHVEFKKGEGGNVSYNGKGKDKPKERRRCILRLVFETTGDLPGLVRPDNIRHTHFSRSKKRTL